MNKKRFVKVTLKQIPEVDYYIFEYNNDEIENYIYNFNNLKHCTVIKPKNKRPCLVENFTDEEILNKHLYLSPRKGFIFQKFLTEEEYAIQYYDLLINRK